MNGNIYNTIMNGIWIIVAIVIVAIVMKRAAGISEHIENAEKKGEDAIAILKERQEKAREEYKKTFLKRSSRL